MLIRSQSVKILKNTKIFVKATFQSEFNSIATHQYQNFETKLNKNRHAISNQIRFDFVKQKDIEKIKQQNKDSSGLKIISKACGFFMKQAWTDFKQDYQIFINIRNIPIQKRSVQQKQTYRKIKIDMIKFGPAICIFNVPFGFPLFYAYLKLFPQLIPSWMMIDSINNKIQALKADRKVKTINYYIKHLKPDVRLAYLYQAIHKQNQSLQDLRRISCICYGDYIDGTQYLSQKLGINFQNGLVLPIISKFLINLYLKNELYHDYKLQTQLKQFRTYQAKLFHKLKTQLKKNQTFQQQIVKSQ